jgi:hypothetical protein
MRPAVRSWTRDEMMKGVAFFRDLKGSKTGLPDTDLPECERELINVIGFQPPDNEGDVVSPVGAAAARLSAIPISEGFNLGFCPLHARARPAHAQSRHERDVHADHRPLALRPERGPEYEFVDVGPCDIEATELGHHKPSGKIRLCFGAGFSGDADARAVAWVCELYELTLGASLWGWFLAMARVKSSRHLLLSYNVAVTPLSKTYAQK